MKVISTEDFGKELKRIRKKKGYTQAQLSEISGFSASFISELENGKKTAEIGKAFYLVNLLGLDINIDERN